MTDEACKVIEHKDIGCGYHLLKLKTPSIAQAALPGQFVHIRVPALEISALRRPFSIFNADAENAILEVLYKTVGRGTAALNAVKPGEDLTIMGPLGRGFPVNRPGMALLVGGGYGVAPLYFLARRLIAAGQPAAQIMLFAGGRTATDLLALDRFEALGVQIRPATNDGSKGMQGLVTAPLDIVMRELREQNQRFELFACGPDPMLRAVAERATGCGAKGWISMDRHMVCGVGACYACIQRTVKGNARCCIDGPIFPAEELVW